MRRRVQEYEPMPGVTALRLLHQVRMPGGVSESLVDELGREPTAEDVAEAEDLFPRLRGRVRL